MKHLSRSAVIASLAITAVASGSVIGTFGAAAAPHHPTKNKSVKDFWAASGDGWGSDLKVGDTVRSERSALTQVHCGNTTSATAASTPKLDLSGLGTIGSITSDSNTKQMPNNGVATDSVSQTVGVNLLDGLITAKLLSTDAWAQHDGSSTSGGGAKFVDLKVAGVDIPTSPQPNTTIGLPGVGSLTLNFVHESDNAGVLRERVSALKLKVTNALPGLSKDTVLVIGHSTAEVQKLQAEPMSGSAYGDNISVPGLLDSGRTFRTYLPCAGTGGQLLSQSGAGINIPNVLTTGVVKTTGKGVTSKTTSAATSSSIAAVNLLDGVVTATAIKAKANVKKVAGTKGLQRDSDGSEILGLSINGTSYSKSVAPNTSINLAGIGTLWLDKTDTASRSITVHEIELDLSQSIDGYAAGTIITVGSADARIRL